MAIKRRHVVSSHQLKHAEDKISKTIITFDSRCLPLIATLICNRAKRLTMPSLIITGKALRGCTFILFFRLDNHHTVFAPSGQSFQLFVSVTGSKNKMLIILPAKRHSFLRPTLSHRDHRLEINEPCDILLPRNHSSTKKRKPSSFFSTRPSKRTDPSTLDQPGQNLSSKIEHTFPDPKKAEYVKKEGKYLPRKQLNYYAKKKQKRGPASAIKP